MIEDEVDPGAWRQGGELLEKLERLEEEVGRAVVPLGLQRDEDAAVGREREALLRNRWAEQVAAEVLEPRAGGPLTARFALDYR